MSIAARYSTERRTNRRFARIAHNYPVRLHPFWKPVGGELRPEQIFFSHEAKRVIAFRRNDFAIAGPLASRL
jgi:hypothetical protein